MKRCVEELEWKQSWRAKWIREYWWRASIRDRLNGTAIFAWPLCISDYAMRLIIWTGVGCCYVNSLEVNCEKGAATENQDTSAQSMGYGVYVEYFCVHNLT